MDIETINLNSVQFGQRCDIGWVTSECEIFLKVFMKNELGFLMDFCGLSQFTLDIEGSQILIINRFCNNYHGKFPIGVEKISCTQSTRILTYFLHGYREFFLVIITKPIYKQNCKFETLFVKWELRNFVKKNWNGKMIRFRDFTFKNVWPNCADNGA